MSGTTLQDVKDQELAENSPKNTIDANFSEEDPERVEKKEENSMPSAQEQEATLKKKYGGIIPKKPPLISKDHERAFFDSADWALGKQGAPVGKPKGPLEALRPKLQPTPSQQLRARRSAYAPSDNDEDGGSIDNPNTNMED